MTQKAPENVAAETILAAKVRAIVGDTSLRTQEEFDRTVEAQLNRITTRPVDRKRKTILALAEAEINPNISRASVFKRKDCVSERNFYSRQKSWFHDPLFREVLEVVMALYRRWAAEEDSRQALQRLREWNDRAYRLGGDIAEVTTRMLTRFLEPLGLEDIKVVTEDGENVVYVIPRYGARDIPGLAMAADKLVRLSLGQPTDKMANEVSGPDGKPLAVDAPGLTNDVMADRIASLLNLAKQRQQEEEQAAESGE